MLLRGNDDLFDSTPSPSAESMIVAAVQQMETITASGHCVSGVMRLQ
jgi:hypothetical protein